MGKRNIAKYKKKKQQDINENIDENNIDNASLRDLQTILNEINSDSLTDREHITTILSSYQFRMDDKEMLSIITSPSFLAPLVSLLNDNYYQIKYNTIGALINIIVSFSECEVEIIILTNTDLINLSVKIIKEFIVFDKKSSEHVKVLKTLSNLLDLYMLLFDLYNEEIDSKVNYALIINEVMNLVTMNKDLLNDDLYLSCNLMLGGYFSKKMIPLSNEIKAYLELANVILNDTTSSECIKNSFAYNMFYLTCANNEALKSNNINLLPKIIERIYSNISNEGNIISKVDSLNKNVMQLANEGKENNETATIKQQIKNIDKEVNSHLLCMKVYEDIIEGINIENTNITQNENVTEDDYEEIEDENENEIEEEIDTNDKFADVISNAVNDVLKEDNYAPLRKMLTDTFMISLSKYCDLSKSINQFLIHDTDKMLTLKENIEEIEFISLSMINNILAKFANNIINENYAISLFSFLMSKIQKCEKNNDLLSLYTTTLRNLITKFTIKNINDDQYQILYQIFIKIENAFIKSNLIDVMTTFAIRDKKFIVGKILKDLIMNQSQIEVISHLVNSFMDLFCNDDLESNKILKDLGVIEMMKQGLNEFKSRMKNAKVAKEIDKDTFAYIKETLLNMKRFIKYKEKSFIQLHI